MSVVKTRQNMGKYFAIFNLDPRSGIWNTVMGLVSLSHTWKRVTNLRMGLKITCNLRVEWPKPLPIRFFVGGHQSYTYKIVQGSRFSFFFFN